MTARTSAPRPATDIQARTSVGRSDSSSQPDAPATHPPPPPPPPPPPHLPFLSPPTEEPRSWWLHGRQTHPMYNDSRMKPALFGTNDTEADDHEHAEDKLPGTTCGPQRCRWPGRRGRFSGSLLRGAGADRTLARCSAAHELPRHNSASRPTPGRRAKRGHRAPSG